MSVVVNQPYLTSGNGGRKLVNISNGWLVGVLKTSDYYYLYVDKKDGNGFSQLCYLYNSSIDNNDISIVGHGNKVILLGGVYLNYIRAWIVDVPKQANVDIYSNWIAVDTAQQAIGNVSLAIDPSNGHLHATWASKNSTRTNSFNIRYSKSTDGGVTWSSPIEETKWNNASVNFTNPSIVFDGKYKHILCELAYNDGTKRIVDISDNPNVVSDISFVNVSAKTIYNGGSYAQSSPSAVVDKDGVIHVAWHGLDSTSPSFHEIRYAKSMDGGTTWSTMSRLTNEGKNQVYPSITTDKTGKLNMVWQGYNASSVVDLRNMTFSNNTWSGIKTLATNTSTSNPSTLYDGAFTGQFGDAPPTIYQNKGASVEYIGTYTTNNAPTVTLNTTDNTIINPNDTFEIPRETSYQFKLVVNDTDVGNVLSYQIKVGGVITIDFTTIENGVEQTIDVDKSSLISGMNSVDVVAKDDQGGETTVRFNLTVNDNIPIDSSCLANMRFNGYNLSTLSLAELVNHLE